MVLPCDIFITENQMVVDESCTFEYRSKEIDALRKFILKMENKYGLWRSDFSYEEQIPMLNLEKLLKRFFLPTCLIKHLMQNIRTSYRNVPMDLELLRRIYMWFCEKEE